MPTIFKSKKGHRRLRGTEQLKLQKEILQLQKDGMGIPEITATLQLAKGVAIRHLYGSGERRLINQIIEEATIDALITFGEMLETVKIEATNNKVLAAIGKLNWTPEQTGTMARAIEKLAEIIKLTSGRGVAMFQEVEREAKDPRLLLAQQTLERLKHTALNGQPIAEPIEEADEVDAESTAL